MDNVMKKIMSAKKHCDNYAKKFPGSNVLNVGHIGIMLMLYDVMRALSKIK